MNLKYCIGIICNDVELEDCGNVPHSNAVFSHMNPVSSRECKWRLYQVGEDWHLFSDPTEMSGTHCAALEWSTNFAAL